MVQYVEYLRAKRALFVVAILLAILFLGAVVVRLIAFRAADPQDWARNLQSSPTAHVSTQQLADGGTRTVIDDPAKRTHAVIVKKDGYFRMDIDEPSTAAHDQSDSNMTFGNLDIRENPKKNMSHVTISYHHDMTIPLSILFLATIPFGLLVATMLGGTLAKENDGHLELAWTKPASRERMALLGMGIDAAAIAIAEGLTLAVYLCCILMFGIPRFTSGDYSVFLSLLTALVAPIAWYAALTSWSASLKSHLGMVIGLGWPAALLVPALAHATEGFSNLIGRAFHAVFLALSYIDPIAYLNSHGKHSLMDSMGATLIVLVLLIIVYTATSVLQWRRVEA